MPVNHKNLQALICFDLAFSRVDWIRTSDPLHPIQVRYRAAPLPEMGCKCKVKNVYKEKISITLPLARQRAPTFRQNLYFACRYAFV